MRRTQPRCIYSTEGTYDANVMNEKLEAIPEEKRERILAACIDEFAEYGYEKASTNRIVRAAGISKGLLFHYFGNKKNLFLYVLDHVVKTLIQLMKKYSASLPGELFERLGQTVSIKLRVAAEAPKLYRILYDAYVNVPADIKAEMTERYGQLFRDQREKFLLNIDASKLKDSVSPQIAVDLITDFLDGYYRRHMDEYKTLTPEQLLDEMDRIEDDVMQYLDIIKAGIYWED